MTIFILDAVDTILSGCSLLISRRYVLVNSMVSLSRRHCRVRTYKKYQLWNLIHHSNHTYMRAHSEIRRYNLHRTSVAMHTSLHKRTHIHRIERERERESQHSYHMHIQNEISNVCEQRVFVCVLVLRCVICSVFSYCLEEKRHTQIVEKCSDYST